MSKAIIISAGVLDDLIRLYRTTVALLEELKALRKLQSVPVKGTVS